MSNDVWVQVPFAAPNKYNPNLFLIGDAFGLFFYLTGMKLLTPILQIPRIVAQHLHISPTNSNPILPLCLEPYYQKPSIYRILYLASGKNTVLYNCHPKMSLYLRDMRRVIRKSFINIFRINFAHSVGKLLCVNMNTSLSIKYCFIFSRIRVSRNEIFFSESPIISAMSL